MARFKTKTGLQVNKTKCEILLGGPISYFGIKKIKGFEVVGKMKTLGVFIDNDEKNIKEINRRIGLSMNIWSRCVNYDPMEKIYIWNTCGIKNTPFTESGPLLRCTG